MVEFLSIFNFKIFIYLLIFRQFGGITKCEALYRADEERHFISKGNNLQMKYHVSKDGIGNSTHTTHPGFVFTITAVMEGENFK